MKEQTKKFYLSIILSLIALFLISCDNKNKTGEEEVKKKEQKEEHYLIMRVIGGEKLQGQPLKQIYLQ